MSDCRADVNFALEFINTRMQAYHWLKCDLKSNCSPNPPSSHSKNTVCVSDFFYIFFFFHFWFLECPPPPSPYNLARLLPLPRQRRVHITHSTASKPLHQKHCSITVFSLNRRSRTTDHWCHSQTKHSAILAPSQPFGSNIWHRMCHRCTLAHKWQMYGGSGVNWIQLLQQHIAYGWGTGETGCSSWASLCVCRQTAAGLGTRVGRSGQIRSDQMQGLMTPTRSVPGHVPVQSCHVGVHIRLKTGVFSSLMGSCWCYHNRLSAPCTNLKAVLQPRSLKKG